MVTNSQQDYVFCVVDALITFVELKYEPKAVRNSIQMFRSK